MTTDQMWQAIASNARQAQETTNWVELLDEIKLLCALIDERIDVFQRRIRAEQLLAGHRIGGQARLTEASRAKGGERHEA